MCVLGIYPKSGSQTCPKIPLYTDMYGFLLPAVKKVSGPSSSSSKIPELLKAEDVRTHVPAIFLRICAKLVLLNGKEEKALFYDLARFDKIL